MVKKAVWISALASALALVTSANGLASVSKPTAISGPSPVVECAGAFDAGQIGRNYPNAEVEPQVSVSGDNIIAMYHQDRWSSGGGHGIGVNYSKNAGATWGETMLPINRCTSTDPSLSFYLRASDPWVSFGPDGTAYASALVFNLGVPNWDNAVAVATSTDGATWQHAQAIKGSAFTQFAQSTDKNATTADPKKAGYAYTVWDTLIEPTDNPNDNPHTSSYTGPAYFSKTKDGGVSWSEAKIIIDTKQRQQTIGNIIVVDPTNGDLYDFTDLIVSPNTPRQGTRSDALLAFVKSTNGGDTWTAPQVIAPFNSLGVVDPNDTTKRLRVGDGLEEVAIDSSGKIYVVWESSTNYQKQLKQSSGAWDDEILMTTSSSGGASWTTPIVVHQASGKPTYTPTVAVNGNRVAVTYYDNRNLQPGQTKVLPTDYWVSISTDGGAFEEQPITTKSFDQLSAPFARGFFLGDYEGLQPSGTGFTALFVKTNCEQPYTDTSCGPASSTLTPTPNKNPTDVFIATVS